jgi:hypothetical protein
LLRCIIIVLILAWLAIDFKFVICFAWGLILNRLELLLSHTDIRLVNIKKGFMSSGLGRVLIWAQFLTNDL